MAFLQKVGALITGALRRLPSVLQVFNVKYVLVVLLLSTAFFALDSHVKGLKIDNLTEKIVSNEKSYRLAQEQAKARAIAEKTRIDRENLDAKIKADNDYRSLRTKYDAALLRFKARHPGRTNLPGETTPAGNPQGTSEGAFFPVTELDLEICAENTAKAETAHDWVTRP